MQTEIKKLTILFLLIFPLIHIYGQEDLYSLKLGASAGFLNLDKSYSLDDVIRPSDFGLELGKSISPAFVVSAGYIYNTDINSRLYSSLLFHSDNGWLLSKRSVIAPIGGIGLHYYPDEKDKLFMAGEAGLKLRFSDRLSSNITFLTYLNTSKIKTFDFSDLQNQTIKLSLNYHFGKKKSDYNSPVFYAGTFLGQQDDSITSSLYTSLFADEENQETKTDSLLRDVPVVIDTLNQTGRNETYQADTLQALVLDSLSTSDVKPDTLENIMLSVEPPDSLKSQEAEIKTDSVSSQAYIAIDTIPSEPDTIIIEYPDSLTEILNIDSAAEKPVLEKYSDKIIVNNIFNLSFSDSTISIELSNGQDLIIMHQPQHVFMDKPVSAPNPQTISVPASRNPDSLQNITNLVQTYPVPLPPAQNQMGDRTGTTQEIGIQPMHSYGKGPDSLLLEQNRLLFEILAKLSLSATPSNSQFESEPVNQVLPEIQIVQKDSITKTDTIIKTGSIVVNAEYYHQRTIARNNQSGNSSRVKSKD